MQTEVLRYIHSDYEVIVRAGIINNVDGSNSYNKVTSDLISLGYTEEEIVSLKKLDNTSLDNIDLLVFAMS